MNPADNSIWLSEAVKGMKKEVYSNKEYDIFEEQPENLYISLCNTAALFPEKPALVEQERQVTFKQCKEIVDRTASNLYSTYGVRKGDRVALLMVNSIDFCICFYALAKLGSISVPLNTKSKSEELLHPLEHSGAKLLVLDRQWWKNVEDIIHLTRIEHCIVSGSECCHDIEANALGALYKEKPLDILNGYDLPKVHDHAVIMYTSGTTGAPKGVLLSHFNILHGIISYKRIFGLTDADSTVIAIPIFHITGLAALMGLFVHIGGTIYLQPYFNAEKVLQCVEKHNITFLHGSPTVFILLLQESEHFGELRSLKKAACGSANMPPEVLIKIKKWLPSMDFHTVYGLTETSSPATIFPVDVYGGGKIGSSGLPIPGLSIKTVDEQGNMLPPNKVGELLVKGTVVLEKYWNNLEVTDSSIKDGWFKTGDLARIDDDGYLYIVDRKKDMINRGGEKIYSLEVENVLYRHPAVKEVAVIGIPDALYGEIVKAVIALNEQYTLTEQEIKKWASEHMAKYKVPEYVEFVDSLPHTASGKISKRMVRELYGSA